MRASPGLWLPGVAPWGRILTCWVLWGRVLPSFPMSSTKHRPHRADPTCEGPAPTLPLQGRGFQGSPWQGVAARGPVALTREFWLVPVPASPSRICWVSASWPAPAWHGPSGAWEAPAPLTAPDRVTPGQQGEAHSAPLTPGWVPSLPSWRLYGQGWGQRWGPGPAACRYWWPLGWVIHSVVVVFGVQFAGYSHSTSPRSWKSWKFLPPAGK